MYTIERIPIFIRTLPNIIKMNIMTKPYENNLWCVDHDQFCKFQHPNFRKQM